MGVIPAWIPGTQLAVLGGVLLSLVVVRRFDRSRGWDERRRARLLLGVPWGTVATVVGVLAVYLFVQGGYGHWYRPVVVAFRAWSYFYPLGMIAAPFAHTGPGHLVGNVIGTLVLGTLAEYAWGHFPQERGSAAFSGPLTNPYARAFGLFPAGVIAVGVLTGLFSWGPIIGFSGVVFAFVGFALVRYPLGTVVALGARDIVRLLYFAASDPVVVSKAEPEFVRPWWAGVAVQGHLLGLILGVVLGALVLRRRDRLPASRLWVGAIIVTTSLSLWAIWWFRGNSEYVLYRGRGALFVLGLALLITLGVAAVRSDRLARGVPLRHAGLLALVFPALVVGMVAVPLNLTTVAAADDPVGPSSVEVGDYTVTYAENVTNRQVNVVNVSALGESTAVPASGVIVVSEDRHLWSRELSASRLKFTGTATVQVGGVGWRETVGVVRRGWVVADNGSAYVVWLRPPDGEWRPTYVSDPVVAAPVLAGRRVAVVPTPGGFFLDVRANGASVARVPVPEPNASVTAGGFEFVREGRRIYATYDGTVIEVAKRERYR